MSILMILLFLTFILLMVSCYGLFVCSLKDIECPDTSNTLTKLVGSIGVLFSVFLLCQTLSLINNQLRITSPEKADNRKTDEIATTNVAKQHTTRRK